MRKVVIIMSILSMIFSLVGCNYHKTNNNVDLPKCSSEECYWGEGKDYVDYCKYFYDENTIKKFDSISQFKIVSDADAEIIEVYLNDFILKASEEEHLSECDLGLDSLINVEDKFFLINYGDKEFKHYTLYYLDISEKVLYYINVKI